MNVSFNHLGRYEFCFIAFLRVLLDEIRKEEHFQDSENDEEFDQNDSPQCLDRKSVV